MSMPVLQQMTQLSVQRHLTVYQPDADRAMDSELELTLGLFLAERSRLFRIAYRVFGDIGAAEDVIQEAWLRWLRASHAGKVVTASLAWSATECWQRKPSNDEPSRARLCRQDRQ